MSELSDFDLDLSYGQEGEKLVEDLLTGDKTIEVKRDRRWKETGNLFIETEFWSLAQDDWTPSGIMVTKAEYWAFVLESMVLLFKTEQLKKAVMLRGRQISNKKLPNPSRGYLITINDLLEVERESK